MAKHLGQLRPGMGRSRRCHGTTTSDLRNGGGGRGSYSTGRRLWTGAGGVQIFPVTEASVAGAGPLRSGGDSSSQGCS